MEREEGDPQPLDYLNDAANQKYGGLDINLEVYIQTEKMRAENIEPHLLSRSITKLAEEKSRLDAQLSNANFVERAPADKVQELRDRATELEHQITTLNNNLEALG